MIVGAWPLALNSTHRQAAAAAVAASVNSIGIAASATVRVPSAMHAKQQPAVT